jgi:hypothetical protein
MGRRDELLRAEAEGWEELNELLARLAPPERERSGATSDGWSVKDLLWHVAYWCADAERALGQMRAGTFDAAAEPEGADQVDAINDAQLRRSRGMTLEEVRAEWHRARAGMLEGFGELPQLTAEADAQLDESGPLHYAEHLPELRAWVAAGGA